MSFQKYGPAEVKILFVSIDSHLTGKAQVIVIGGTAALLAYKATKLTQDIDSFNLITKDLRKAYETAKSETGMNIPLSQAAVADGPYNFEDRLVEYQNSKFKRLSVLIPEIHDLVLMKTVRGYEHDLDLIEEIAKKNTVQKKTLIERFETEMDHVIGNQRRLNLNFAAVLARCFGEKVATSWVKAHAKDVKR